MLANYRSLNQSDLLKCLGNECVSASSEADCDISDAISDISCDLCLSIAIEAVLELLPLSFSALTATSGERKHQFTDNRSPKFVFGPLTIAFLADMVASSSKFDCFYGILEKIDPENAWNMLEIKRFLQSFDRIAVVSTELPAMEDCGAMIAVLTEGTDCAVFCSEFISGLSFATSSPGGSSDLNILNSGELENNICDLLWHCSRLLATVSVDSTSDNIVDMTNHLQCRLVHILQSLLKGGSNGLEQNLRTRIVCSSMLRVLLPLKESDFNMGNEKTTLCFDGIVTALLMNKDSNSASSFLHDVIVFGLLNDNAEHAEDNSPLLLVELLIEYQLNALSKGNLGRTNNQALMLVQHYSPILGVLKLLVWKTNKAYERNEVCPNCSKFVEVLQDSCLLTMGDQCSAVRPEMNWQRFHTERSLIMGLFHTDVMVRKEALLRFGHFYGLAVSSLLTSSQDRCTRAASVAMLPILQNDMEDATASIKYTRWQYKSDDSQAVSFSKTTTFSDIWNLSRVAFGIENSHSQATAVLKDMRDIPLRLLSLKQLLQVILSGDSALKEIIKDEFMSFCDIQGSNNDGRDAWLAITVTYVVNILDEFVFFLAEDSRDSNTIEFVATAISLLYAMIKHFSLLSRYITFLKKPVLVEKMQQSEGRLFYMNSLLQILFSTGGIISDNLMPVHLGCWSTLCIWACCWIESNELAIPTYAAEYLNMVTVISGSDLSKSFEFEFPPCFVLLSRKVKKNEKGCKLVALVEKAEQGDLKENEILYVFYFVCKMFVN